MAQQCDNITFQGLKFPGYLHTEESIHDATALKFQDTDTLIVTYPKSGKWLNETKLYKEVMKTRS